MANASTERQRRHFETIADTYFLARQDSNHLLYKELLWNNFIGNKPDLRGGVVSVLEPMCGYAEGYSILQKCLACPIHYSGFDASPAMIATIKKRRPDLDVWVEDVTEYVPRKQYDIIMLIGGLHHVPEHASIVMRMLCEGLRSGGYFILFEPTQNCWLTRKTREFVYRRNALFDATSERGFELRQLIDLCQGYGLHIREQLYPGLLSYVLYYNPDAFPRLNIGGQWLVRALFNIDAYLFRTVLGRLFSFATLTLLQKS